MLTCKVAEWVISAVNCYKNNTKSTILFGHHMAVILMDITWLSCDTIGHHMVVMWYYWTSHGCHEYYCTSHGCHEYYCTSHGCHEYIAHHMVVMNTIAHHMDTIGHPMAILGCYCTSHGCHVILLHITWLIWYYWTSQAISRMVKTVKNGVTLCELWTTALIGLLFLQW